MKRSKITEIVGLDYLTSNVENDEYSYAKEAGGIKELQKALGRGCDHYTIDMRFELDDCVLLVETKTIFTESDKLQLKDYLDEERALHPLKNVICILANTSNDDMLVWMTVIDDAHLLSNETVFEPMQHYKSLFFANKQNDRERVLKNTVALNDLLQGFDIDEKLRSQFVGTTLLYIKDIISRSPEAHIDQGLVDDFKKIWKFQSPSEIRAGIGNTLTNLLDGSENKNQKINLLQKNVIDNQKIKKLTLERWIKILETLILDIYRYIDTDSSEGQDILNLFFIAFNKYSGKADKNQAFTPDHITDFMCKLTEVDRSKVVFDGTCGSGSFLVQAMVKELADCKRGTSEEQEKQLQEIVKEKHIYGVEIEENAYGLATTNMLIHGDGNSNIILANLFDCKKFIQDASPSIILMNPPYNAKPITIPDKYKEGWNNGIEDPTKGLVFIRFISDVIEEINCSREKKSEPRMEVKLAVLLPLSAAIGRTEAIKKEKRALLENNTLEAVFTLPNNLFYPGSSVKTCCMLFTLGKRHFNSKGYAKETFFGFYIDDGFVIKRNLGRVEQYNVQNESIWKSIENQWLNLYRNKKVVNGLSSMAIVDGDSEWLCEAYMETDYENLKESDFQNTINSYLSYLVKEGLVYES